MAGAKYRGFLPATDPIYQRGSTFLTGMNLNPHWVKKMLEREAAKQAKRDEASAESVEKPGPGETNKE
jgi:hypothetical protein